MKDLIILGNGMAGMTAALYAKRANLDFKVVGKDEYDFGQIGNAILVENYPCAASQSGFDLAMSLHDQLDANGIKVEEHEVKMVSDLPDGNFMVEYTDGTMDWAKSIVYALGATYRSLPEKITNGMPIHYCALCDGALYKNKTVAIIGGGDVAFTQAEYLSKICEQVFIIMCDENVTAARQTLKRVSKIRNISIQYNYPIDIIEYSDIPSHYILRNNKIKEYYFAVDGIFVAIGMTPNTQERIVMSKIVTDTLGYITASETGKTAIEGFFAAGDVRAKSVRQSVTAAADGAYVINSVIAYLARRDNNENA